MHAPQTFYCHEQKAYKHKVLFPMSEGLIALVKFSLSYKPNHPTIHSESSEIPQCRLDCCFPLLRTLRLSCVI